ncbi:MAG TPA: Cj0069 family protein [Burkholderiales bacterium]
MKHDQPKRVAILYAGTPEARETVTRENCRFQDLIKAFAARGTMAEPAVWHDTVRDDVKRQLLRVDAVLVWVNPVEDGRDRAVLDALLREVASKGILVSTHPDVILKLGTKEVLHSTRSMGWGCDTRLYASPVQMKAELPAQLALGKARVLKQYRGNGGDGIWKLQLSVADAEKAEGGARVVPTPDTVLRVRHAKRGSQEENLTLGAFLERCAPYFAGGGRMIDQAYQPRLPEGMIRCYLVGDRVAGFGHQAVNALYPAPPGARPSEAPQPGPRLYHPPDKPEFQALKQTLEAEWVPAAQKLLAIDTEELPLLWDCDFLLGPKTAEGEDSYVLCEINVSCISPYPEAAVDTLCDATLARLQKRGQTPFSRKQVIE